MAAPSDPFLMYIYNLPYAERTALCRILDLHDKWEELGGVYMRYDVTTLHRVRQAILRDQSPTNELLTLWQTQNHTVLELFVLLSSMKHYQAMMVLKPLVDPKFHRLIYEGEEYFGNCMFPGKDTKPASAPPCSSHGTSSPGSLQKQEKDMGYAAHNLNQTVNNTNTSSEKFCLSMVESEIQNNTPSKLQAHVMSPREDKENNVPTSQRENNLPVSNRESNLPASNRENNLPISNRESNLPISNRESNLPISNRESNLPISNRESNLPVSNKEINLPVSNRESNTASSQRKLSNASSISSNAEACTPLINYHELEAATNGWDRHCILGRGGFGTVFKGTWKNTQVAIKRLELQKDIASEEVLEAQRQQSLRELKYLNSFRHDNILPLYGYSVGGDSPCLVYQFMPNGSLEDRLLCRHGSKPLNWVQRQNISIGTARGLQYLHSVGDKPLIHGDIKSANILLDPNFEPKIGDFGLAREGPLQQYTHVKISRVHGTRPYLPDELLRGKKFSKKVDTFSFGVVLFELATGLRAYDENRQHRFLYEHVEEYNETLLSELADTKAGSDDNHTASGLMALGKCCVRTRPSQRPEMVVVLQQLNIMASERVKLQKAHSLLRHNTLSPSTPYELQLVHDHSQQRRLSVPNNPMQHHTGNSPQIQLARLSPLPIPAPHPQTNGVPSPHINVTPPSDFSRTPVNTNSPSTVSQQEPHRTAPSTPITTPCDDLPLISALGIKTPTDSCE